MVNLPTDVIAKGCSGRQRAESKSLKLRDKGKTRVSSHEGEKGRRGTQCSHRVQPGMCGALSSISRTHDDQKALEA